MQLISLLILATDFPATRRFYRDQLQLPVQYDSDDVCILQLGTLNLVVQPRQTTRVGNSGITLSVHVPSLMVVRSFLEHGNVPIRREWRDGRDRFMLVADPEGNLIEICQLENNP